MSETNGFAGRDVLLNFQRKFRPVEIEGVGKFRIRNLNQSERQAVEAPNYRQNKKTGGVAANMDKIQDQQLRYVVACVVDGNGNQLYGNSDIDGLRAADAAVIDRLSKEIYEFCGVVESDAVEKKDSHSSGSSQ